MAVKIRLKRMGAKKTPFYRIVVSDSRSPRDGRFIEEIGYYNPLKDPAEIKVKLDRSEYWLSNGAQPSDTVRALLKKAARQAEQPEAETVAQASAPAEPAPAAESTAAPEPVVAAADTAVEPVEEPAAQAES